MDHERILRTQIELVSAALHLRVAALHGGEDDAARARYERARARFAELEVQCSTSFGTVGLTSSESVLLWTVIATALDAEVGNRVLHFSNGVGLTEGVAKQLVYGETASATANSDLSPFGRLSQLGLLERRTVGASEILAPSRRVIDWVHGERSIDPELRGILSVGASQLGALEASGNVRKQVYDALGDINTVLVLAGPRGVGKRSLCLEAASMRGLGMLVLNAASLASDLATLKLQLQRVARDARLFGRGLLVRDLDLVSAQTIDALGGDVVEQINGPIVVTCTRPTSVAPWNRVPRVVAVPHPTSAQRASVWQTALGEGTEEDAEYLATQYPIAPALIHHAATAAKARANGRKMEPEDIYAGVRAVLDDKLGDYARRVEVTQTWDDLVLPEDQMEQVQYLIARIRQRRTVYEQWGFAAKVGKGLGTSALFSGPPGTGKTMVAALIAKELGIELYQVDMAKITSKYIGETERNLAALFDAAEAGHAILLFDEADSLFGKRTEVKSSNDRYANLETNYLLQRLESFTGICLLTSNHESNIDPAFQRRLSLHVRFELPEAEERAALWQATLPAAAPVAEGVDFMKLAKKYEMSGGYIRNAALRAAFLAADEGSDITAAHLERAAKLEYEGMGKIAA